MATLNCPFCGVPETERFRVEDRLVVVFPCMFTPVLDGAAAESELPRLVAAYAKDGKGYFQKQCDRLHYFVTKGAGTVLPDVGDSRGGPSTNPPVKATRAL